MHRDVDIGSTLRVWNLALLGRFATLQTMGYGKDGSPMYFNPTNVGVTSTPDPPVSLAYTKGKFSDTDRPMGPPPQDGYDMILEGGVSQPTLETAMDRTTG